MVGGGGGAKKGKEFETLREKKKHVWGKKSDMNENSEEKRGGFHCKRGGSLKKESQWRRRDCNSDVAAEARVYSEGPSSKGNTQIVSRRKRGFAKKNEIGGAKNGVGRPVRIVSCRESWAKKRDELERTISRVKKKKGKVSSITGYEQCRTNRRCRGRDQKKKAPKKKEKNAGTDKVLVPAKETAEKKKKKQGEGTNPLRKKREPKNHLGG